MPIPTDPQVFYHWSREEVLPLVPIDAKKVLDVGCATGGFGYLLKERRGADVWGIELDAEQAEASKEHLGRVMTGDVNEILPTLPQGYFDAIVFNDVLEHLYDPYTLLKDLKQWLSPQGVVIASLPNIRFYRALKHILFEKEWQYADKGIFDRTHVRFFTLKSMMRLWDEAGYDVEDWKGINGTSRFLFKVINAALLGNITDSRYQQYAFRARPRKSGT